MTKEDGACSILTISNIDFRRSNLSGCFDFDGTKQDTSVSNWALLLMGTIWLTHMNSRQ